MNFLAPQFLQHVADRTPLQAGLLTAPIALSAIAGSLAAPALAARFGAATVITVAAAVSVVGYAVISQTTVDSPVWQVVAGGALAVFGLSPATVLTTDLVVAAAPQERAGAAAALSETSGELGVALGVAVVGSIVTAVYRVTVEALLPDHLPPAAAAAARTTVDAAHQTAGELPHGHAQALIESANTAFTSAFAVIGYVGILLTAVLMLLAHLGLRHTSPTSRAEGVH